MADQDAPGTDGNRDLRYDVLSGIFQLRTTSYARIRCDMDFKLYPFDTQKCLFTINGLMSTDYQEEKQDRS